MADLATAVQTNQILVNETNNIVSVIMFFRIGEQSKVAERIALETTLRRDDVINNVTVVYRVLFSGATSL
jgi:hypothetical protein